MVGAKRNRLRVDSDGLGTRDLIGAESEISALAHYLSKSSHESVDAFRHLIPMRVIACVEGCLKAATAELVNHGEPYRSNLRRLTQQVKIDFDVLKAVLEDSVTLGDIVAHAFSWHDFAAINSRMTTILGLDFFNGLKNTLNRFDVERRDAPKKPIIESLDKVLADLSDAMSVRHALCHEVATFERVSEQDAARFIKSGKEFTSAVSWLISETLHPGAPLTQTDMNIESGKRATAATEEMHRAVATVAEKLNNEDKALLAKSQDAWEEYRKVFCMLESNAAKGGTLAPLLYGNCSQRMAKARLQELQESLRWTGLEGPARRLRRPR